LSKYDNHYIVNPKILNLILKKLRTNASLSRSFASMTASDNEIERKRFLSNRADEGFCLTGSADDVVQASTSVQFRVRHQSPRNDYSTVPGISSKRAPNLRIETEITNNLTKIQPRKAQSFPSHFDSTNKSLEFKYAPSIESDTMSSSDDESFETAVSTIPSSNSCIRFSYNIKSATTKHSTFSDKSNDIELKPASKFLKQNKNYQLSDRTNEYSSLDFSLHFEEQHSSLKQEHNEIQVIEDSSMEGQKNVKSRKLHSPTPSTSESSHSEDTLRESNQACEKIMEPTFSNPRSDEKLQRESPSSSFIYSSSSYCSDRSSLETNLSGGFYMDDSPFCEKSSTVLSRKLQLLDSPYTLMSPISTSSEVFLEESLQQDQKRLHDIGHNNDSPENQDSQSQKRCVRCHPTSLSRTPFTPITVHEPNNTEESPSTLIFQMIEESPQILLELSDIETNIEVKDLRKRRHRQELYEKQTSPISESSAQSDIMLNATPPTGNDVASNTQEKQDSLHNNSFDESQILGFENKDCLDEEFQQVMIGTKMHDEMKQLPCSENIDEDMNNRRISILLHEKSDLDLNSLLQSIDEERCHDDESNFEMDYGTLKSAFQKLLKEKGELQSRLSALSTPYEDRVTPFRDIFEQNRRMKVVNEHLTLCNQKLETQNTLLRSQKEQVDVMINQLQQQTITALNLAVQQSTQLKQKLMLAENRIRDLEAQLLHVEEANISLNV
jgi:hypothetical protein